MRRTESRSSLRSRAGFTGPATEERSVPGPSVWRMSDAVQSQTTAHSILSGTFPQASSTVAENAEAPFVPVCNLQEDRMAIMDNKTIYCDYSIYVNFKLREGSEEGVTIQHCQTGSLCTDVRRSAYVNILSHYEIQTRFP